METSGTSEEWSKGKSLISANKSSNCIKKLLSSKPIRRPEYTRNKTPKTEVNTWGDKYDEQQESMTWEELNVR